MCGVSMWISPAVCNVLGSKATMFVGALCFIVFICSFFFSITWLLYVASGLVGSGAALLWTGQSAYLILNSNQTTLETNLGLFFVLYQSGAFIGNLVIYFLFTDKTYIDAETRNLVLVFVSVVVTLGTVLLLFLPHYEKEDLLDLDKKGNESNDIVIQKKLAKDSALIQSIESPFQTFKKGWKIIVSVDVLILLFMFFNIGFSYIFTIVYNSCLGFTRAIPKAVEMLPFAGLMSGIGGMVGGILPAIIKPELPLPFNIRPLMLLAFICYVTSYVIAFLNFPDSSIFGYTYDKAYIHSSAYLGILGSLLLHIGEVVYNNETAVLLAKLFPNDTVSAFAVFLFCKNCFSALTFTGSNFAGLHTQLLCLTGFLLLGTLSFWYVSKRLHRRRIEKSIAGVPLP
ncbi:UNC93-like protein MFSD11 [Diaphorina citri]|uniref:UNC93-like protein MFSD11 n=1 Tax=Diaphorina citri TaxID=121845 RepID=A0A1S4E921_DIACI|nr:UNC93-like protein MFSD11 [Diaphorina citri]